MQRLRTSSLLLLIALMLAAMPLAAQSESNGTLLETLEALPDAQLFNEALQITGASADPEREPHTVFVPTDAAFAASLDGLGIDLETLEEDSLQWRVLRAIVLNHLVVGTLTAEDFRAGQLVTVEGDKLIFRQTEAGLTINHAEVVASHEVEEGALHEVSATLMPTICDGVPLNGSIGARLGPGFNRGRIGFLPADVLIPVTGQFTDETGRLWYRLDKTIATPNKQAAEIWTLAENLMLSGVACELIPVIPQN